MPIDILQNTIGELSCMAEVNSNKEDDDVVQEISIFGQEKGLQLLLSGPDSRVMLKARWMYLCFKIQRYIIRRCCHLLEYEHQSKILVWKM